MTLVGSLYCVAALLALSVVATAFARTFAAGAIVYGACLAISMVGLSAALAHLIAAASLPETLQLPIGLPWLGANFRVDALAAFFLLVVNLGGGAASLYALGYGRHEQAPQRVLPFY